MRRNSLYIVIVVCTALLLNACSKKTDGPDVPNPDPPITGPLLSFPKKEMRSVWMTTAWGLDWPQTDYNVVSQKQQYINYLEKFKSLNINTIFFQVKPMGDAFYNSPYEPWSVAITGTRGKDPGYDVLKFMIDEAHARDIEFHAWMNPYRIATRTGTGSQYPALHTSVKSEWVVDHEKIQIYNPAVPEVRQRLADIVKDIITKYDIDGIHFDDYFYPDPSSAGQMVSDQTDFTKYGQGYSNVQDFRRGNVDKAIKAVYDIIVATKPAVVFSVSPAPSRDYNYNTLFADVVKWCQEGWIDIVMPQLYQEIGNKSNDFQANLAFWAQNRYEAAVMIGHGYYKFGDATAPSAFQSTDELQKQFDLTNRDTRVLGNAMYSAKYITMNKIGITDKLASIYKDKVVMPFLGRGVAPVPPAPTNVRIEGTQLKWNASGNVKSIVYYFANKDEKGKVLTITKDSGIDITAKGLYSVSTLNVDNQESDRSSAIEKK